MTEVNWTPLESNAEVMTEYAHALGLPEKYSLEDCLGLDEELLALVPANTRAVVLIYPYDEAREKVRDEEQQDKRQPVNGDVWYMTQLVGNACGTIALIHAIANTVPREELRQGSPLARFFEAAKRLETADARGRALAGSVELARVHKTHAEQGQTDHTEHVEVDYHFVCLCRIGDKLYELDGARPSACPILHGQTSADRFVFDAAQVVEREWLSRFEGVLNFGIVTLSERDQH